MPLLNESRLNTAVPRSRWAGGRFNGVCGWPNRLATEVLARRAWAATGSSLSSSSSSKTGAPKLRLNGNEPFGLLGD